MLNMRFYGIASVWHVDGACKMNRSASPQHHNPHVKKCNPLKTLASVMFCMWECTIWVTI